MQKLLNATQPRFVFDFAHVRELDAVGIHLLLQCLEEVMKLNGDVKLAALPPGPAAMLERAGVDSLFEIFDSTADAVQSFYHLPLNNEEPMRVPLRANHTPISGATAGFAAD
jgi:anti-anti-sigma regulatory factor